MRNVAYESPTTNVSKAGNACYELINKISSRHERDARERYVQKKTRNENNGKKLEINLRLNKQNKETEGSRTRHSREFGRARSA